MLDNRKEIKLKIATDKPFRSIYWTPTKKELRQMNALLKVNYWELTLNQEDHTHFRNYHKEFGENMILKR